MDALSALRIISPRSDLSQQSSDFEDQDDHHNGKLKPCVRFRFPLDFVTAPLIADLFLLAILAIGRKEVHDGTVGADHISPIDIMVFFLSLAYIAISIDASGLIRFLAFKVLQKGGKEGHRLFLYLYAFFFSLGSFIGNDPIILSGTAFLAYMTRVSSNIKHPRAWIHTQFAVANIASAILVSSNPTNLVLAGAFDIKFVHYTANMIVPVIITAIVLFPFLLYVIFAHEYYIPLSIEMHTLSDEAKARKPVNPNIPHARGTAEELENNLTDSNQSKLLSLEEIMNPFLDKGGAAFGAIIMATTLITLLALNAASQSTHEHPVYWVTLPAAFVMFCWDVAFGWIHRRETREIARKGREEIELARAERALREENARLAALEQEKRDAIATSQTPLTPSHSPETQQQNRSQSLTSETRGDTLATDNGAIRVSHLGDPIPPALTVVEPENGDDKSQVSDGLAESQTSDHQQRDDHVPDGSPSITAMSTLDEKAQEDSKNLQQELSDRSLNGEPDEEEQMPSSGEEIFSGGHRSRVIPLRPPRQKTTLVSLLVDRYRWSQETFPTVTAVVSHLPFKLVPFALSMFVLVQALVTKGWVPVFAHGWDHWVDKTGTVGAIGGMGFLSVILCNVSSNDPLHFSIAWRPNNISIVCRNEHRHYHPFVPRNTSVARHS